MKKLTVLIIFQIVFTILTFVGAGYVLINKGQVNAGYAVIPCVIAVIFNNCIIIEKRRINKRGDNL